MGNGKGDTVDCRAESIFSVANDVITLGNGSGDTINVSAPVTWQKV
jgi:hypothetical protein